MLPKPRKTQAQACALLAYLALGISPGSYLFAQPEQAAPVTATATATLNRLFTEAEAAFASKKYLSAVDKIRELLVALGSNTEAPLELLNFNIGLGYLLGEKPVEAEAAFKECLKKFPKGEYASRCYLGIGRASIQQNTPAKKQAALEALKIAAKDPKLRSEAGLSLGQVYIDLGNRKEAMVVFKSLMGSDIRTPQQTTAAVEVISLLAILKILLTILIVLKIKQGFVILLLGTLTKSSLGVMS